MPTTPLTTAKNHPVTTGNYLLAGTLIFTVTTLATILSNIIATTIITPVLTWITLSDLASVAIIAALYLLVALLAAATPYTLAALITDLTPYPSTQELPRYEYWTLLSIPITLITLTALWYPVWTPLAPTLAQSIPASIPYNYATFPIVLLTATTTLTFTREDLKREASSTVRTSNTTSNTNTPSTTDTTDTTNTTDSTDTTHTTRTPGNSQASSRTATPVMTNYEYDWQEPPELTFADVGGMHDIKTDLHDEIITPLNGNIETYEKFGITIPNLLFHGPPGTGKSYLAEALAGELQYPYVKLSAGEILSKWINQSGEQINQLFREAESIGNRHGHVIVFLDEIDALLSDRSMDQQHSENKKVVNEFLNHLEDTTERSTLVVGATNNYDDLDRAAVRSGRFDSEYHIDLPDQESRVYILKAQLRDRPVGDISESDLETLCEQLDGKNAADIESIVESAGRCAIKRDGETIEIEDLVAAVEDEL
jgi:transitional endoplasmic reticulum ATPase